MITYLCDSFLSWNFHLIKRPFRLKQWALLSMLANDACNTKERLSLRESGSPMYIRAYLGCCQRDHWYPLFPAERFLKLFGTRGTRRKKHTSGSRVGRVNNATCCHAEQSTHFNRVTYNVFILFIWLLHWFSTLLCCCDVWIRIQGNRSVGSCIDCQTTPKRCPQRIRVSSWWNCPK